MIRTKPHFILTTCGTSLLTNGADDETREVIRRCANSTDSEVAQADKALLDRAVSARRDSLAKGNADNAARMSAELNGLMSFYDSPISQDAKRRDVHYFVASDTYVGRLTRDLAMGWLRDQGFENVVPLDVPGIRTSSLADFRDGATALMEQLDELIRSQREAQHTCSFNLSGGFKSVNAFLQMLGALWADEVFFVFETSRELIRIPKLPLALDIGSSVRAHFDEYRRLDTLGALPRAMAPNVPDGFCLVVDDEIELSPWVAALFKAPRATLYGEAIWPPWHAAVAFGPTFLASTAALSPDRRQKVNERIDDLCRYAETTQPLKRLDLKALKGGALQGSTHEADAWSDQSAMRLFLHKDGPRWIIDRLAPALH